jgi:hypothetical protein
MRQSTHVSALLAKMIRTVIIHGLSSELKRFDRALPCFFG